MKWLSTWFESQWGFMGKIKCRNCGSYQLLDSRERGAEPIIHAVLPLGSFRCKDCMRRGNYRVNFFNNYWRVGLWTIVISIILLLLVAEFGSSRSEFYASETKPSLVVAKSIEGDADQGISTFSTADASIKSSPIESRVTAITSAEVELVKSDNVTELTKPKSISINRESQEVKPSANLVGAQVNKGALEESVNRALETWKSAWAAGNVAVYLSMYSDEFTPSSGVSYQDWTARRRNIVGRQESRRISLRDMRVKFSNDGLRAVVDFKQNFKSDFYQDHVSKRVYLKKQLGRWLILREDVIESDK